MRSVARAVFLCALGAYFAIPMLAMARFAFQAVPVALLTPETMFTGWSLGPLISAISDPMTLRAAWISLTLALLAVALNLALLVPAAIVVEVRAPQLRPLLVGLTLLPWVVPPIALVVGVAGTFRLTAPWFLASTYSLVPFYALWALPFTYRALDAGLRAFNARTLYEAARVLGASLPVVIARILLPNMRASITAAGALTIAFVFGEFAFASLLLKSTLPTYLVVYQGSDPRGGLALALLVMVLTALVIWLLVRSLRRQRVSIQPVGV
ncbi:MAG: ABC transporter permease subunit [Actinomycetales bacterium]|nr:ABC transporter permease subunit [Actinomycetales bacterium]